MRLRHGFLLFLPGLLFGQASEVDSSCLCSEIKLKSTNGFYHVEWSPEYPGGYDALKTYLSNNVNFNETDEGIFLLSFLINCNGATCGYKVESTEGVISKNSEVEILNALQGMSAWKPARQNGQNLDIPYTLKLKISNGKIK